MRFLMNMSNKASTLFGAALLAGSVIAADAHGADPKDPVCPWVVIADEPLVGLGSNAATYEIAFTGLEDREVLYGFTLTDKQLALQLARRGKLEDMAAGAEPLQLIERDDSLVYQVSADSVLPRTIYLVVALDTVDELEQIDARIEPSRAVSVAGITRGGTDHTGPLPHRSVPGREVIAMPTETNGLLSTVAHDSIQLCAYQVSYR